MAVRSWHQTGTDLQPCGGAGSRQGSAMSFLTSVETDERRKCQFIEGEAVMPA